MSRNGLLQPVLHNSFIPVPTMKVVVAVRSAPLGRVMRRHLSPTGKNSVIDGVEIHPGYRMSGGGLRGRHLQVLF